MQMRSFGPYKVDRRPVNPKPTLFADLNRIPMSFLNVSAAHIIELLRLVGAYPGIVLL